MDAINWRNTLLSWANKSGFIEKPFASIEHINLNEFFELFKQKMLNQVEIIGNIVNFLKVYYPEFEPNFDETGQLTSADYMYVYSLFLHFSCVRYPEPWFQQISCGLNVKCQDSAKDFLATLVKEEKFDRHSIRQAIRSATPATPRLSFLHLSTPIGTPVKAGTPSTPTSHLLETKLNEAKSLRAQLEGEKYGKGFLEVQNRQYEERLNKLINEQKQNLMQINELKNELLSKEKENYSPNHTLKQKNYQSRVAKQINDLNEEIIELKSQLEDFRENNATLTEKLKYSEKLNREYLHQLQDSEDNLLYYQEDIEQKQEKIEMLMAETEELQLHITQLRDSMPREVLDSSTDLLEDSRMNCFDEPESLDVVIDMKLKEVERENRELREKIVQYNMNFSSQINELFEKYGNEDYLSDKVTLEEHIDALVDCYEMLAKDKIAMEKEFSVAKANLREKESQLDEIIEARQGVEKSLEWTRSELETLKSDYQDSVAKNEEFTLKCSRYKEEIELLRTSIVSVTEEKDTLFVQLTKANESCDNLQLKLTESTTMYETLRVKSDENQSQLDDAQKLYKILEDDYQKLSTTYEKLKSKSTSLLRDFQKLSENNVQSKKIADTLSKECLELKDSVRMADSCVKDQQMKLQAADERESVLRSELSDSQRDNEQKSLQIQELTDSKSNLESELTGKQNLLTEFANLVETLKVQLESMKVGHENEIQCLKSSFEVNISTLNVFYEAQQHKISSAFSNLVEMVEHLQTSLMNLKLWQERELKQLISAQEEAEVVHKNEIEKLILNHEEKLRTMEEAHSVMKEAEINQYAKIVEKLTATHDEAIRRIEEEHKVEVVILSQKSKEIEGEIATFKESYDEQIKNLKESHKQEINEKLAEIETLKENHATTLTLFEEKLKKSQTEELQEFEAKKETEIAELSSKFSAEKNELIEDLNATKDLLKSKEVEHELKFKTLNDENEIKICELKDALKAFEANLAEKEQELEELNSRQAAKLESLKVMHDEETKKLVNQKDSEIEDLKKSIEQLKVEYDQKEIKTKEKFEGILEDKLKGLAETLGANHSKKLQELQDRHQAEIDQMIVVHSNQLKSTELELTNQINEIREEHASIAQQIDGQKQDFLKQLADYETQINSHKENIEQLGAYAEQLKAENVQHHKDQAEIHKAEIEILQRTHTEEIQLMQQQISDVEKQIEKLKAENDKLEVSVAELKEERGTLIESLEKVSADTLMMSEESEAVNSTNKKLVETIEQLKAEKNELEQQLHDAIQTAKSEVQSVKDDVQIQLVTVRTQLLEEMKPVQSVLEKQVQDFEGQLTEQKRVNQTLIEANKLLTHKLATMKDLDPKLHESQANLARETKRNQILTDRLHQCQENLESKEGKMKILNNRIDYMQAEVTKHEGESNLLQQQQKKLETELAAVKQECETLRAKYKEAETLTEEFKNSGVQSKINQNELEMRVASLSTENETLVLIADKLKEDNQTLQEELEVANSKAEIQIENIEMENQKMKHQLHDATNTITNLRNESTQMQDQMTELQRKYEIASAAATKLEQQFIQIEQKATEDNVKVTELQQKLDKHKLTEEKLNELRDKYLEEHDLAKAQQRDIQILQAKLLRSREKYEEENREHEKQVKALQDVVDNAEKSSDQKVKDVRAQLEEKLAEMKQKMRELYTEEIAKRDTTLKDLLADYDKIKGQGVKMAQQLHKLNEEKLEMISQNQFLKYRLQQYEVGGGSQRDLMRRQSAIPSTLNQRNFKTEEEEGELFSNTYLTDLKEGRMQSSESNLYNRQTLQLEEIQKRNSMMLPHMRSVYFTDTANMKATEEDIRAGAPINPFDSPEHDDSGSSLLHSRNDSKEGKKIVGKLAYHKPGPPTPSKNAGRLSVGKDDLPLVPGKDEQKKKSGPKLWSSSKVKDESNGFDLQDVQTSTPRRKRRPVTYRTNRLYVTKHRPPRYGSPPAFNRLLQEDTFSKKYLAYRHSTSYHVTSSEDGDSDCASDIEVLETDISPVVTVNESEMHDQTIDVELVDTPKSMAVDPRGDRKTLRKLLKRKSQEHRLANFNSHRKKTPKSHQKNNSDKHSEELTAEHQISETKPASHSQSRDLDASFLLHRPLPPIERASEMFYARPIEPPQPVTSSSSPQKCSIQ